MTDWVIAYDIQDARVRRRALRTARSLAISYQHSVFECQQLVIPAQMQDLACLLQPGDSLLAIRPMPSSHWWHIGEAPKRTKGLVLIN